MDNYDCSHDFKPTVKEQAKGIYERIPLKANHNWLTSSLISPFATLNYKFE